MDRYRCGIIGGGLAGLTLAIQLARQGEEVILFEKEQYPFHRVCGEYISMESWDFLCSLGLDLPTMKLPQITRLAVSAPNGNLLSHPLQPGGFGISRFTLDMLLAEIAKEKKVEIIHAKVSDVLFSNDSFIIETAQKKYSATLVFGAFGKRSNLDVKLKRTFIQKKTAPKNNYVGVKYHVNLPFPDDLIELHNFKGGYCGLSKVDGERYCLCYLTTSQNLRESNNDIKQMEEKILMQNPHLKKHFKNANFLYEHPLTISQIDFSSKPPVENHLLMVGDSSGLITPLCGNGMSMALHASKIAATLALQYFNNNLSRHDLEQQYARQWKTTFSSRLFAGRTLQRFFGQPTLSNLAVNILKKKPEIMNKLVTLTHGKPF